ncbi:MAG: hypothetical protein KGH50_02860, partial [Candidatus Micrarchaeota archaeon]|nr:hypothetical protein [Candidatus Micrarchaeota archaeon]
MESKLNALKERIQAPYERKPNGTIGSEDESFVIRKDPRTSAPIAPRLRHNNRLWLELRRASGFVPVQGDKWHIMEGKDAFVEGVSEIVTDMGHQVEKVNKRAYTIEEAVANVVSGRRLVSEAAGIMGSVHVAPGLLPFNAPDRNAMVDKSRYTMLAELYNNDIYLMCINGSFQVHVKVGRDEAMDLLNASQASSVAEYAWFANSPILDGKDTGYHSHRGMTWLKLIARDEYRRELDRGRVGITGPYENWDSWLEELVDRSFLFTKRLNDDGSDRYLSIAGLSGLRNGNAYGVITFRDYIDKGSAVAYNPLTGKKERITLEDVDIAMHMHTWWTEARLTTHGTVEDRAPDNSGKTGHIAAMIAFKKGLYHNLKEAA